jgi:hypothetical protein
MRQVGFESTIWEYERAKTFRALDRTAAVIGSSCFISELLCHLEINTSVYEECDLWVVTPCKGKAKAVLVRN